MKIFIITLLALTLAAIIGVSLVWIVDGPPALPLEVAKACLNILTAAVIVQLIAFVVARAADRRKVQAEDDECRRAALTRLNTAFTGIKALRREARANLTVTHSAQSEPHLARPAYNQLMKRVNAIQLDLELLAKDIETSHGIFTDSQSIYIYVSHMEEYLNGLVDEWEASGRRLARTDDIALSLTPALRDLLGNYEESHFRSRLVHTYYKAGEELRKSMTAGVSLRWKVTLAPILKPSTKLDQERS